MLKMATYPGMSLGGEVRESVSLDEDDLSDVEDEVFIRDGKNGYKIAEDLNAKRPLMAPRKRLNRDVVRLKSRPPCRAFCKPCCYVLSALGLLIGIITLVVVLVSMFPLPLDRIRDWAKGRRIESTALKLLPCSSLNVKEVWMVNLPVLTTDSPIRTLDVDGDGYEDVIFGFGTGENYNILPPDVFCPIFMGVSPPCEGGLIALSGSNGDIIWRYWSNDTFFSLHCTEDVDGDGLEDCLTLGFHGTISMINARNGKVIWTKINRKLDIYLANFIPDQNNDGIPDVLASHTYLENQKNGHLLIYSGKNGKEIKKTRVARTFFMPQLLDNQTVIFGTGGPDFGGTLYVTSLDAIMSGNLTNRVKSIYDDPYKGMMTQAVLVDITGDNYPDIIMAMYNSTMVAFDGRTFDQIWNYTVPNGESLITPTPAYFNDDNITDFLIIYQKYDNILNYNYTQTYIIDGQTGKSIYTKSISSSVITQMGGLTLSMESHGFDMYVFWTSECIKSKYGNEINPDINRKSLYDICSQHYNLSNVLGLNALNQYDQPPGFEIYSTVNRSLEFDNVESPIRRIDAYIKKHPKFQNIDENAEGQSEVGEVYPENKEKIKIHKYGISSFRHKDNNNNQKSKEYLNNEGDDHGIPPDTDYDVLDFPNYDPSDTSHASTLNQPHTTDIEETNRNPPDYGIYDFRNVRRAKDRLLNDLDDPPDTILRDTYRRHNTAARHRDVNPRNAIETPYTLWDLESEKEAEERRSGRKRRRRNVSIGVGIVQKVASAGVIISENNNTDIVIVKYWQPYGDYQLDDEIDRCVGMKILNGEENFRKTTLDERRELYKKECTDEMYALKNVPYYAESKRLRLGQMSVYRLRLQCECDTNISDGRCIKFLPKPLQTWTSFLGNAGDGVYG